MSNPYFELQEAVAARLALHATLAKIPMVTEEKGDIEKRIQEGLLKGGIKQSPALAEIPAPAFMTSYNYTDCLIAGAGEDICNGDTYTYAISYVTAEGETLLSNTFDVPSPNSPDYFIRLFFDAPPARVTAIRLWRSVVSTGEDYWLLAELPPATTQFDDHETHAEFAGRYDPEIEPALTNTTAVAAKGGLAFLIFTPSGRGGGNTRTLVKQAVTVRVALFCKPLINDGPSGHQIAPLEAHWAAQLQMLSWNRGAGQPPVTLELWDSEESNQEISYYNDFSVPLALNLNP